MHDIAGAICGMLAVEISMPLIRLKALPLAEDFLHTGRSIVMMEVGACYCRWSGILANYEDPVVSKLRLFLLPFFSPPDDV